MLADALDKLEQEAVDWYLECEQDKKDSGQILGDGKELRRARRHVESLIKDAQNNILDRVEAKGLKPYKDNPTNDRFIEGYDLAIENGRNAISEIRREL